jgi:hypothetical protein
VLKRAHLRRLQISQQARRRMQMLDESPTFITPRGMTQLVLPLVESPQDTPEHSSEESQQCTNQTQSL